MPSNAVGTSIEEQENGQYEVAPDLLCARALFVNFYMFGAPGVSSGEWVLIDTGLGMSAPYIFQLAEERYGRGSKPHAIILTHGHFDHVGAVVELVNAWQVPVYAHELELPYLTGQQNYPMPDPTVDNGLIARMSVFFPHNAIDLGDNVHPLPEDGSVPGMPGWRWLHTPGHSPGQVALFRDEDRVLIAADTFVTVKQESAAAVLTQAQAVHGPPKYLTTDWPAAKQSVKTLHDLDPAVVATGHGVPMRGDELRRQLGALVRHFDRVAVPEHGKYVPAGISV